MPSKAASSSRRGPACAAPLLALFALAAASAAAADPAACLAELNAPCLIAEAHAAAGRVPVDFRRAHTLVEIARLQAETGEAAGARASLALARATWTFMAERKPPSEWEPRSDRDFIASEIVKVQATLGDLAAAQATAGAMANASFREISADPEIAKGLARAGDPAAALVVAERLEPSEARDGVLGEVARALVVAGDLDGALGAVDRARDRVTAFDGLVYGLAYGGETERAYAAALREADPEERSGLLAMVATFGLSRGDLAVAERTAADAPTPYGRNAIVLKIVRFHAERGDLAATRAAAARIDDPKFGNFVRESLARVLAQQGAIDEALAEIAPIQGYNKQMMLGLIGEAAAERDAARGLAIADGLETYHRERALRGIADRLWKRGDKAAAFETLSRAERDAQAILAHTGADSVAVRSVALTWAGFGEHDRAVETLFALPQIDTLVEALRDGAAAQARDGAAEAARQTIALAAFGLEAIDADDRRDDLGHTVAVTQAALGDTEGAADTLAWLSDERRALALAKIALGTAAADPRI